MKTCCAILLLTITWTTLDAETGVPATPAGIIILKAVPGYPAAETWFVSIQWVDRDSGFVVDQAGKELPFLNEALGRIIYFDSGYYAEIDHNPSWIDWRAGLQNREAVVPPIPGLWLRPEDSKRVADEQAVLQDAIERYPNGAELIQPLINTLKDEIGKLERGQSLQGGVWIAAKDSAPEKVQVVGDSEESVTFTTKDGKKFWNARVTATAAGLSVLTSEGGASVAYEQLPDDLAGFPKTAKAKIADWRAKHPQGPGETGDTSTGWWTWIKGVWQVVVDKTEAYFSSSPPSTASTSPPVTATPTPAPAPATPSK